VRKNGRYTAINYFKRVIAFLMPFLSVNVQNLVQKYECKECESSFSSLEQKNNILTRDSIKLTIMRLIVTLRYGNGMSVRGISRIIGSVYGFCASIGFIDKICQNVANAAQKKMEILNHCTQNKSEVLMYDETFPKVKDKGCINLGVATCENGLIRKVQTIDVSRKSKETYKFFKTLITKNYKPSTFISDYDTTYPIEIRKVLPDIIILKDFVHTIRQIFKDGKSAINKTVVTFSNIKISKEKKKKILDVKKKLLRKQLNKVTRIMTKGFKKKYCAVGTLYIEGGMNDIRELSEKFPTLKPFYQKLNKFVKKNIDIWNTHMERYHTKKIPLTSNIIESKNSIFKAFSKKSKSYSGNCINKFFCAVALHENFDIKRRGTNKGTSAMSRAGIDLREFGAENFFDAVGMPNIKNFKGFSHLKIDIN
jgi:transposase-like protein